MWKLIKENLDSYYKEYGKETELICFKDLQEFPEPNIIKSRIALTLKDVVFWFKIESFPDDDESFISISFNKYLYEWLDIDKNFSEYEREFFPKESLMYLNKPWERYLDVDEAMKIVKEVGKKFLKLIDRYYTSGGNCE